MILYTERGKGSLLRKRKKKQGSKISKINKCSAQSNKDYMELHRVDDSNVRITNINVTLELFQILE